MEACSTYQREIDSRLRMQLIQSVLLILNLFDFIQLDKTYQVSRFHKDFSSNFLSDFQFIANFLVVCDTLKS